MENIVQDANFRLSVLKYAKSHSVTKAAIEFRITET